MVIIRLCSPYNFDMYGTWSCRMLRILLMWSIPILLSSGWHLSLRVWICMACCSAVMLFILWIWTVWLRSSSGCRQLMVVDMYGASRCRIMHCILSICAVQVQLSPNGHQPKFVVCVTSGYRLATVCLCLIMRLALCVVEPIAFCWNNIRKYSYVWIAEDIYDRLYHVACVIIHLYTLPD